MGYCSRYNNLKEAGGMINEIDLSQNKNIQIRALAWQLMIKCLKN